MKASVWSITMGLSFAVGCGGKTEARGDSASNPTGGRTLVGTLPAAGGSITASGGAFALGGSKVLTGGSRFEGPGGSSSAGGTAATGAGAGVGAGANTGGRSATGGALPTGGKMPLGGASTTGGKTASGGLASTGGTLGLGGFLATGGTNTVGGAVSTGGSSGTDPLSAFCQGDKSKVLYHGQQEVQASATNYVSANFFDCCWADGINLHSRGALGFDIDVEVIWSAGVNLTPRVVTLGTSTSRVRAEVRPSTDSATSIGDPGDGTLEIFGSNPLDVGVCLRVYRTQSIRLYDTLVYVPRVSLSSTANQKRFQIYLLSDSTITQAQAIAQGLDTVSLAPTPLLDLGRIAYVSSSALEIGFNPGQKIGEMVLGALKGSLVLGIPFVILADGERVTFGAFESCVSSIGYGLPTVLVEDIESDWLVFGTGGGTTSPLDDPRIVASLTSTGKLIP